MKRTKRALALSISAILFAGALVGCVAEGGYDAPPMPRPVGGDIPPVQGQAFAPAQFIQWFYEEAPWRTPINRTPANNFVGGFVEES
jgi:hypothetical protein